MVAGDGMAAEQADLIVRNAKVTTLADGGDAVAEAVAVRGRISRDGCDQRSSRSATSAPERERPDLRIGAARSGALRTGRCTHTAWF